MTFAEKYGPWALITGASEGTGAAFARQIAAEGVNLILVARREGPLAELAAEVRALGVECVTASVDLSQTDAADRIAAAAEGREVGLFIANAGADTNGSKFLDAAAADWDALININVVSTMRNCHHFAAPMKARGRGGIIIVGSGACYGGLSGMATYCGSKAFALAFGVEVLSLILGRTDTPAHRKITEESGHTFDASKMASSEDVARLGLERLPHGPIQNWGETDDTIGMSPNSPAQRREKILMIEKLTAGAYSKPKQSA
jgi:uncharacterized protein